MIAFERKRDWRFYLPHEDPDHEAWKKGLSVWSTNEYDIVDQPDGTVHLVHRRHEQSSGLTYETRREPADR